jgi:hypothetical protein
MKPPSRQGSPDEFQTPGYALNPLLPYLDKRWVIWECACGNNNLAIELTKHGYKTVSSDILGGSDFMEYEPPYWYCIVTNPPYRYKQEFLERAYQLGKPFAFLMPLTTLETSKRQRLFDRYGLEVIFMDKRINFETPSGRGSGSWFATAWFTNGLNIGKQMTFAHLEQAVGDCG